MMQRICPDYLTGVLLDRSEFEHLKLPAQFKEDTTYKMPFENEHVAKAGAKVLQNCLQVQVLLQGNIQDYNKAHAKLMSRLKR